MVQRVRHRSDDQDGYAAAERNPGHVYNEGADAAVEIARIENMRDPEAFRNGGEIVILEPPERAGTYDIEVNYEPSSRLSLVQG